MNWPLFILAIFGLGAALGFGLWLRLRQWRARWEDRDFLLWNDGELRIRADDAGRWNAHQAAELVAGTRAARDVLPLTHFWVEVVELGDVSTPTVPSGKLRDGRLALASIRTERLLPWTQKVWVAVVTPRNAGALVVHEVVCHVASMGAGRGLNADHEDLELAKVEKEALRRYRELRP